MREAVVVVVVVVVIDYSVITSCTGWLAGWLDDWLLLLLRCGGEAVKLAVSCVDDELFVLL